jgi:hypothetical protein
MILSDIHIVDPRVLLEAGYGRIARFDYNRYRVDKRPRVFVLGRWRHPGTGNTLLAGINLNYLSEEEVAALRQNLGTILAHRRLKDRYWEGMKQLPKIFSDTYRTYRQDEIINISREVLRKWPSIQAQDREERARKWREMSPEQRAEAYKQRAAKAAQTKAARAPSSVQRRRAPIAKPEEPKPERPKEPEEPEAIELKKPRRIIPEPREPEEPEEIVEPEEENE